MCVCVSHQPLATRTVRIQAGRFRILNGSSRRRHSNDGSTNSSSTGHESKPKPKPKPTSHSTKKSYKERGDCGLANRRRVSLTTSSFPSFTSVNLVQSLLSHNPFAPSMPARLIPSQIATNALKTSSSQLFKSSVARATAVPQRINSTPLLNRTFASSTKMSAIELPKDYVSIQGLPLVYV